MDDHEAASAQRWANQLGAAKSERLRDALHRRLMQLASSEHDAQTRASKPATSSELAIAPIVDWGPAEDWSDWVDAPTE